MIFRETVKVEHTHTHTQTHIYVHMHTQLRNLPLEFFLGINLDQYANI